MFQIKENPIKNDNRINILYIGDIVNRLIYAIDNSASVGNLLLLEKNHMFYHPYTIFYMLLTKLVKGGLSYKSKNYYTNDMPDIDYKNVKLHDIPSN